MFTEVDSNEVIKFNFTLNSSFALEPFFPLILYVSCSLETRQAT